MLLILEKQMAQLAQFNTEQRTALETAFALLTNFSSLTDQQKESAAQSMIQAVLQNPKCILKVETTNANWNDKLNKITDSGMVGSLAAGTTVPNPIHPISETEQKKTSLSQYLHTIVEQAERTIATPTATIMAQEKKLPSIGALRLKPTGNGFHLVRVVAADQTQHTSIIHYVSVYPIVGQVGQCNKFTWYTWKYYKTRGKHEKASASI